mmetsp:Transcript_24107/g.69297  ORF Transcript_24107/g.69297 Transcript_24107/m.69297 type:complete len:265 (-) Transcript_24107:314-1108(-)
MVVGVGEQFARLLGGGVRADGVVDVLLLGEVCGLAATIDAGRTGKDEVLDAELVAELHELGGAPDVGMDVDERILDAGPDPGPGGHVAHPLGPVGFEHGGHELLVADVPAVDGNALRSVPVHEEGDVGLLDPRVVVVVHLVDEDDVVSAGEEVVGDVAADESGAAGDEDLLVSRVRFDDGGGQVGWSSRGGGRGGLLLLLVVIAGRLVDGGGGGRCRVCVPRGRGHAGGDGRGIVVGRGGGGSVGLEHFDIVVVVVVGFVDGSN